MKPTDRTETTPPQSKLDRKRVVDLARPEWVPLTFGFTDPVRLAASASRIIFTYGEVDPWHVFAVDVRNLSSQLPVIMIPGGSHCADMRSGREDDTPQMIAARSQTELLLRGWIAEMRLETPHLLSSDTIYV